MNFLILNGSPRPNGTVSRLLAAVAEGLDERHAVETIDVCRASMAFCTACMKCRPDHECVLPEDDAHLIGRKIRAADGLVVGTPTHWGNMSAPLKTLFDRNVPAFMGERPSGMPLPRHKHKPAVIVAACTTPWPFNVIAAQSRGAVRAVREVLHYGGFKIKARIVKPGTKTKPELDDKLLHRARRLGQKL